MLKPACSKPVQAGTSALPSPCVTRMAIISKCDERLIRQMTDIELLKRLMTVQKELKLIQRTVRMKIPQRSREGRPRRQPPMPSTDRNARPESHVRPGRSVAGQGMSTRSPL